MSNQKKIVGISLVVVYIILAFFREFIFLNVNEQSRVTYYHSNDSNVAASMQWLSVFNYGTLYYSKWVLTVLFAVLFAFLASRIVKIFFGDLLFVRMTWLAYACLFCAGFLFYLIDKITNNKNQLYETARFLAGLTEGPGLLVILCASFLAIRKLKANQS
jgi:hypothetical protein